MNSQKSLVNIIKNTAAPNNASSGRFAALTLNRLCPLEILVPFRKSVLGETSSYANR
jgi:hypothetical protein